MKRGEIIKELGDNIIPILQDICEDDNVIWEAIRELEGTRSIEEVRERLTALNYLNHDKMSEVWASRQTELKWFLKEDE